MSAAPQTILSDQERLAWLRLIRTENVGPITFYNLIAHYGSASAALAALPERAARSGRAKPPKIPSIAAAEKEYETVRKLGAQIICASEPGYPLALAATEDAPPVLIVRGQIALAQKPCLAIIGARNASLNGRKFAAALARDLGAAGQVIVSGLARGIDTAAHEGALETGTIAVVAGGIDVVYPPENQALYDKITEQGLLIAENPPGVPPRARDFPRRNRIVSGLSAGAVVVEATERSGSLITARLAAEQGRDVYAVPGHPLDPRASGPNRLIRDGAVLIRSADDVLESLASYSGYHGLRETAPAYQAASYPLEDIPAINEDSLEAARAQLSAQLSLAPCPVDEVIRATGLPASLIQTALLELELAGEVRRLPGGRAALIG